MGNTPSSTKKSGRRSSGRSRRREESEAEKVAARAQQVVGESVQHLSENLQSSIKKLEDDDSPSAQFLDSVCGGYLDPGRATSRSNSYYSDYDDETTSEVDDETTTTTDYRDRKSRRYHRRREDYSVGESGSYGSDMDSDVRRKKGHHGSGPSESYESEESSKKHGVVNQVAEISAGSANIKPLASSFAKRCYFTKAGIGKTTQHYEGLTLTGNVVLMLAAAMKLKGCPTICDEDLRRVEQTYPNQFSRLPDELLLSSGWRRISKYCHFSNKPIPDGVPFFHSKQRLHPSGGFYFLLAAAVGMVRPIDVEPLTRDTLVLLETDYSTACDSAPRMLIEDPNQWTLVDKFCFFSGGPINTEEDVYYQADFDGNPIFMLAFLSPSLTPEELYKLDQNAGEPGLKTIAAVEEVESVYDLTERDFDDLRLYHLGPCRALPPYVLQPASWTKVLPPHFLAARQTAYLRAQEYERQMGVSSHHIPTSHDPANVHSSAQLDANAHAHHLGIPHQPPMPQYADGYQQAGAYYSGGMTAYQQPGNPHQQFPSYNYPPMRNATPVAASGVRGPMYGMDEAPMDEAMQADTSLPAARRSMEPVDEPPSLSKRMNQDGEVPSPAVKDTANSSYGMDNKDADTYPEGGQYSGVDAGSENHEYFGEESKPGHYYHEVNEPEPALAPYRAEYSEGQSGSMHHSDHMGAGNEESFQYDGTGPHNKSDEDSYGEVDENHANKFELPPASPSSNHGSEAVSHTSSAMRGAQELLKRNRQKRLGMSVRRVENSLQVETQRPEQTIESEKDAISPQSESTWESSSEVTSVVSGTSSAWTEGSVNDRSTRRALILQMAKARMKKNSSGKPVSSGTTGQDTIAEREEEKKLDEPEEDIKLETDGSIPRINSLNETGTDIDISQDLD